MNFESLVNFLDWLPEYGVPGTECIVYYDGKKVFHHCSGYADREAGIPMTEGYLFNLYSSTKIATCVAALQLLEKGKYLVSDPLYEYIPEYRDMYIKVGKELVPAKNHIRIIDLFTMSAGFSYNINAQPLLDLKRKCGKIFSTLDVSRAWANVPLLYEPGENWVYSFAHDILGALIEVISGKKLSDYVKENIFDPLDMKNSGFKRTPEILSKMAAQYQYNDVLKTAERTTKDNVYILGINYDSGGAGVYSNADDYSSFAASLANNGIGLNGEKILSKYSIDLMKTNQLDSKRLAVYQSDNPSRWGFGYGMGVRTLLNPEAGGNLCSKGEFGWGGAAGSFVSVDSKNNLAIFYVQHMLNPKNQYIQPRIRNIVNSCLKN